MYTDSGSIENAHRTLLHMTNDSFWKDGQVDCVRLMQSFEAIRASFGPDTISVIEGHRMYLCMSLMSKAHLVVWIHTPHKTGRERGNRTTDE